MNIPISASDTTAAGPESRKTDIKHDNAVATCHERLDPSTPAPGAAEKGERISDAASDPVKPNGVDSIDKGA